MIYEDFFIEDKNEVEKILKNNNANDIISAIIGAVNGIDDWEWLQDICIRYMYNDNYWLASTSIMGISDIARIHRKIDMEKIEESFKNIKNERLKPIIKMVEEDLKLFLG